MSDAHAPAPRTRREMLERCAIGFGGVALAGLFGDPRAASAQSAPRKPHFRPKAKNVIFLYMDGGPSQVDTFDYKPMLEKYHGQDPRKAIGKLEPTQFDNIGKVMKSPWTFRRRGKSGMWVSDLFPHVAEMADDLCVIRSMTSKFPEHTTANYFLHTGFGVQGRPSVGSWVNYGLGSENRNFPGFIVINGGLIPPGGLDNFKNGFLPAAYQGSVFKPANPPVANIRRTERSAELQDRKADFVRFLDREARPRYAADGEFEAAVANFEIAGAMQAATPELMDLSKESEATKKMYGFNEKTSKTSIMARQCLIARRMIERGVRFVELTCPNSGGDRWDQHGNLEKGHKNNALTVDQPIAALLKDLKRTGLIDETLVLWSGEFGRTPFAQGGNGRDHNQFGFSLWMAGAGVKKGFVHGTTDEWGYKAVEHILEIHDLHATMLHLLGMDHKRLTFRFGGRDMRLTDVHGELIHEILA